MSVVVYEENDNDDSWRMKSKTYIPKESRQGIAVVESMKL